MKFAFSSGVLTPEASGPKGPFLAQQIAGPKGPTHKPKTYSSFDKTNFNVTTLTPRTETTPGGVPRKMRRAQAPMNNGRRAGPTFRGEFPALAVYGTFHR